MCYTDFLRIFYPTLTHFKAPFNSPWKALLVHVLVLSRRNEENLARSTTEAPLIVAMEHRVMKLL